jgi:hypothetical protein
MAVGLNRTALTRARKLVAEGATTHDERDDWSEHAPSADEENAFIKKHGYGEYGAWHLGIDTSKAEGTKGRYSFPYGDFSKVHRCAVISLESRAGQYDHSEIETAAKNLLGLIDEKS